MRIFSALLLAVTFFLQLNSYAADLPEAETLYQEAERAYLKSDTDAAMKALVKFFSSEAASQSPKSLVRAHNLKGLIYFQTKNIPMAVQEFQSATQTANRYIDQTDTLLHLTRYNLGNALFQNNQAKDAYETLFTVNPDALDQDTRMRYHHLMGNVLSSREAHTDALLQYLLAANAAKDVAARDTFIQKAFNSSKKIYLKNPKEDLDKIAALSLPSDSPAGISAQVFLARGYMYSGDQSEAESILKKVLASASPSHPLRARAEEMMNDLGKLTGSDPSVIGVLLPLSGKFGKFGRLCLNAISMSLGAFEEMPENKSAQGIRLVVRDSGETTESATAAFEELVKDEKAVAVIGPLLSKQFASVARKAQEFGTPLLSLSQRVEGSQLGSFIFPIALSPNQQIEMIVQHAIQEKGYKRFAILAPDDSFGTEYVNLFWDEVEKRGGEVVGIERYVPKSTDFRGELKRLLGLEYLDARPIEADDMKRRQDQYASTLKVKGKLRQRMLKAFDPKAVVDFDAIFIPDDPATIGQIAPSFAVMDVENIPMLGINTWNTSDIVQRAGRYLQKSIFVDGFFANNKSPKAIKFVQDYMKFFNSIPGTIEVQAYDASSILIEALADHAVNNRAKLRAQLLGKEKYSGISGDYSFTVNGVTRGAHLLTVKGNGIAEISAPDSR